MSNNETIENNKRIAKNTILLYFRMILLMFIGLYTSRIILDVLGFSDYGLYNVVGGVVTIFAFLNGTLSTSTQRFLNIEIGRNNVLQAKKVFSTAMLQHLLLALIIVIVSETIGLWFVIHELNIPSDRYIAALYVYQFSIIAICVQILQLPYMSALIAHENMKSYAYVSLYEAIARLTIVYILTISSYDKLILYGALYLIVQFSVAFFYITLARRKYEECSVRPTYNKVIFKNMLNFSGWNVIGCLATTVNNQGVNVVLNMFFGTTVNAARAIAYQVNGIVNQFVSNFLLATKPQVVNYYTSGNNAEMIKLCLSTAKFSGFLLIIIIVPLSVEMETVLKLWLVEYPVYTPVFLRLILFQSLLIAMANNVVTVVHATGKLKEVGLMAGSLQLLVLPISYILFKLGLPPETAFLVAIMGTLCETFIEVYWMNYYIQYPIGKFYKTVYLPVILVFICSMILTFSCHNLLTNLDSLLRLLLVLIFSSFISFSLIWHWGLDIAMKSFIITKFKTSVLKRIQ